MKEEKQATPRKTGEGGKAVPAPNIDPRAILDAVNGGRSDLKLRANEVVFSQGDPADAIFYIKTGRIQLTVVSDQGKEGVIALFAPGSFFGEGCLTAQPLRLASAVATVASTVVRIDKDAMARLLHENHHLAEEFIAFLLSRTIEVEADLVDQLFNSAEKRLARLLLLLANFNNDGELRPIVPRISQDILAARVGTTRSRVNHFLNKFRKLGLIEYNGSIKVHTALINVIVHD